MTSDSTISGDDRGFLYGDGLFETVRIEDGRTYFLERHCRRFKHSAEALSFPASAINQGLQALSDIEGRRDGLWRITVSRPQQGAHDRQCVQRRWRDFPYAVDDKNVDDNNCTGPTVGIVDNFYFPAFKLAEYKTTSWLRSLEARRQAIEQGFDEALMVSPDGQIGEAAAANIFLYIDGEWVTPSVQGILPGVIREVILDGARERAISIEERQVFVGDLYSCEAMALTSTGRLVTAVSSVEHQNLSPKPVAELKAILHQQLKR